MTETIISENGIVTTPDGKKWIYDEKHEWIEVTMPPKLKRSRFISLGRNRNGIIM